jgi:hypothetical protein
VTSGAVSLTPCQYLNTTSSDGMQIAPLRSSLPGKAAAELVLTCGASAVLASCLRLGGG